MMQSVVIDGNLLDKVDDNLLDELKGRLLAIWYNVLNLMEPA